MARRDDTHDYRSCEEPDCPLFGCRAFKAGRRVGYDIGRPDGEVIGFAEGFAAGLAAAARAGG